MRLPSRISRNSPLKNLNHLLRERPRITRPMTNRMRLQPIKLIQLPINRRIRNEMVSVCALLVILRTGGFIRERASTRKAVVCCADGF
jgi:hypothetical protein